MIYIRNQGEVGIEYDLFFMPDGAPHCKILSIPSGSVGNVEYAAHITSFDDFGLLMVLKDAISHTYNQYRHTLFLYYLPCRQDRREVNTSFDLKIYTDILNKMGFAEINILHPHSNVITTLLDSSNTQAFYPDNFWAKVIQQSNPDAVIIPDAGAEKLISKIPLKGIETIQCLKSRDSRTGKLSAPRIFGEVKNKKLLIIDDICDGGGTFIQLVDSMQEDNVKVDLCITHGLFTKGYKELNKRFEAIYTTNSFHDKPDFDITLSNDCYKVHMFDLNTGDFQCR